MDKPTKAGVYVVRTKDGKTLIVELGGEPPFLYVNGGLELGFRQTFAGHQLPYHETIEPDVAWVSEVEISREEEA